MGFVKTVSGKGLHLLINMRGRLFGNFVRFGPFYKFFAEFFHDVQLLFAHGFAQRVGFARGKPAELFGNFHDLLLIHHTAVGVLKHFFQERGFVGDFFLAVFAPHKHIHHARLHGPRAVERHQGGYVAELRGLQLFNQVAHAAAFQLENPQRLAGAQQIIGFLVVQRDFVNVKIGVMTLADELFGIVNNRQRAQAQKVHFQQPQVGARLPFKLRGNGVARTARQRHIVRNGLFGNQYACGVNAGVAFEAFNFARHVKKAFGRGVVGHFIFKFLDIFQRGVQGNFRVIGNHLGHAVGLADADAHHARHVAHGQFGLHGSKGNNLCHFVGAVFAAHIVNNALAPRIGHINIQIGHADAVRV